MWTQEDRRRYTRIDFANDAVLHQVDQQFPVHLLDISLKGVLIEQPQGHHIEPNTAAHVIISLADEIVIDMSVRLAHTGDKVLGFHCDGIDVESMSHLRRLIELNIQAPNASERVLQELIHPADRDVNRRREKRYPHRTACGMRVEDQTLVANTLNISEHGALIAITEAHSVKPGNTAHLTLEHEAGSVELKGRVAHASVHYIGLECDAVDEANRAKIRELIAQKM